MGVNNWKDAVVMPDTTLQNAISAVDRSALRLAVVVDSDNKLLGIITDGDIRRALIKGASMNTVVTDVMSRNPKVSQIDWSAQKKLRVMIEHDLIHLPIVDSNFRIVGLDLLRDIRSKIVRDNPVVLMAGGFGRRLLPLTKDCPKPMLKLGSTPILEIIIRRFVSLGFYRFYLTTHYLEHVVREYFGDGSRWGVEINYLHEETPLGTAGALAMLTGIPITKPVILMNGDILTHVDFVDLLNFHNNTEPAVTMCVHSYRNQIPYGVVKSFGTKVVELIEKPVEEIFINAGIYVLSPDVVRSVKEGVHLNMTELIERQIKNGGSVNSYRIQNEWIDIGHPEDYLRANSIQMNNYIPGD